MLIGVGRNSSPALTSMKPEPAMRFSKNGFRLRFGNSLVRATTLRQAANDALLLLSVLALLLTPAASAEVTAYPAANGDATARVLVVYSSLDKPLARANDRRFPEGQSDDCRSL
jgi:hypothetical protein